jgi:hypothetical protein
MSSPNISHATLTGTLKPDGIDTRLRTFTDLHVEVLP